MKKPLPTAVLLAVTSMASGWALAQAVVPPTSIPAGESRLPTENAVLPPNAGVANDCRRQVDSVREQYALQEQAARREIGERERQADDAGKQRLRTELEQRVTALKQQALEAERRVQESCRA